MATVKEVSTILKEFGLTADEMQAIYEDVAKTNTTVASLLRSGVEWKKLNTCVLRQLPTQKAKDLAYLEKKRLEDEAKIIVDTEARKQREYYETHFEELMVEKIDAEEPLSEKELDRLREYEVEVSYGENRKWSRTAISVCKLCERFFSLQWENGLTESQPDDFSNQPIEVAKVTFEKTITVTEWQKVKTNE